MKNECFRLVWACPNALNIESLGTISKSMIFQLSGCKLPRQALVVIPSKRLMARVHVSKIVRAFDPVGLGFGFT